MKLQIPSYFQMGSEPEHTAYCRHKIQLDMTLAFLSTEKVKCGGLIILK